MVRRIRDACLMDDDVAPGNRFSSFSPVFPVRDLRRALAHYASLGPDWVARWFPARRPAAAVTGR